MHGCVFGARTPAFPLIMPHQETVPGHQVSEKIKSPSTSTWAAAA